ncbi:MAG: hypothetical protein ACRDOE_14195, partial [Streptosporangiaceae bacterium]
MRLVIVLSVAAAVTVMLGAILVAAGVVMRLLTRHQPANMTRLGLDMVAAGIAFGLAVLVAFAIARIGTAGRSGPPAGTADHRLRAGAPAAGSGHPGPDGGARSGRPPVLEPANVYSPGGLLDVPRDGRAPGMPGGQGIP